MSSQTEQRQYIVVHTEKEYEIRLYPAHIVAQTVVEGTYDKALSQGFGILAKYIFGANTTKQGIAMTVPVTEHIGASESIAMTTPVTIALGGRVHTITFGMPSFYTLETLPIPKDPRVHISLIPEKKMAVMRFGWMGTDTRVESKKQELLDVLVKQTISIVGQPEYASYNAPWTPPWRTRNEVLIEVR